MNNVWDKHIADFRNSKTGRSSEKQLNGRQQGVKTRRANGSYDNLIRKPITQAHKDKLIKINTGKKLSIDTKLKIRLNNAKSMSVHTPVGQFTSKRQALKGLKFSEGKLNRLLKIDPKNYYVEK